MENAVHDGQLLQVQYHHTEPGQGPVYTTADGQQCYAWTELSFDPFECWKAAAHYLLDLDINYTPME